MPFFEVPLKTTIYGCCFGGNFFVRSTLMRCHLGAFCTQRPSLQLQACTYFDFLTFYYFYIFERIMRVEILEFRRESGEIIIFTKERNEEKGRGALNCTFNVYKYRSMRFTLGFVL